MLADGLVHEGGGSLVLLTLRLAGVLGLPLHGGAAALLELDLEEVGLKGEVVPERASQKGDDGAVEEHHAREDELAGLVRVERDDDKAGDAEHALDGAVGEGLPNEVRGDAHLRLAVGARVAREAICELLAIANEVNALGAQLKEAQSACDVGEHQDDDDA